jgi:hypothetical protein
MGWMTKISSINFWLGRSLLSSSKHADTSEFSLASYSFCTQGKLGGPGRKPFIFI